MGKIVPALLTGNTIIVKPSPFTPYTTLKAVEIAQAIFAPGVVQAVGGDDKLGPMLTAHAGIAKISFTGSIATGKKIMAACADTLKRCTLELGGNDASIILPDVDIKKVAPQVVMGAFQNSGQVCVATKRVYIHESIYTEFLEEMVDFTKTIQVGDSESGSLLGPVQNKMQYEKVKEFIEDTRKHGYKFAIGEGTPPTEKGFFINPIIIDNPPNDSRIISEEPFGPIVPTQPWSDEEEVIKRANNTNTGLGACVWGKDVEHAQPRSWLRLRQLLREADSSGHLRWSQGEWYWWRVGHRWLQSLLQPPRRPPLQVVSLLSKILSGIACAWIPRCEISVEDCRTRALRPPQTYYRYKAVDGPGSKYKAQ
jgi:acyl-CoA reductase-like NAD-dependent aldehyde dehydrogenase